MFLYFMLRHVNRSHGQKHVNRPLKKLTEFLKASNSCPLFKASNGYLLKYIHVFSYIYIYSNTYSVYLVKLCAEKYNIVNLSERAGMRLRRRRVSISHCEHFSRLRWSVSMDARMYMRECECFWVRVLCFRENARVCVWMCECPC